MKNAPLLALRHPETQLDGKNPLVYHTEGRWAEPSTCHANADV